YKFFLYYFTAPFILNSLLSKKNSSNQGYLKAGQIENLKIPIPPLSVQIEIVKILDALTALTSELTSELILRQKQYEYYREKLLSEEELGKVGFEWKPLKEIAEYIRGVTYNKTNESPNNIGYKILRANNITLSSNTLNFDDIKVIKFDTKVKSSQMLYKNDILISAASGSREHVGKVAFIYQDIDYYFGGFMGVIRCNNNVNSRYLFHIFTSSIFQDYLNEVLNSSTINNLNSKVMDSFRLPIPPLSVQTEIVKILDKFENLTNSITEGLPLAIEQSQKRYEYYRELLLNFPGRE
ncbi:TPA: restriction endonuclease subunit S, partial [Haemophilus influenzae]